MKNDDKNDEECDATILHMDMLTATKKILAQKDYSGYLEVN